MRITRKELTGAEFVANAEPHPTEIDVKSLMYFSAHELT